MLLDKIVSLNLAVHFYSTVLLVKYSTQLIIQDHFLLLSRTAEQGSPGEIGRAHLFSQKSLACQHWEITDPCCASQTQSQASELGFLGMQSMCNIMQEKLKPLDLFTGVTMSLFHLPHSLVFGSQLGPFEELLYLIKNKLIKS